MKNPNGYGSVVKLAGKRRNPFVVRKTAGWSANGYPVYKTVGYYPTREAGLIALAQYNNDPWDIEKDKITFEELFELWKEKKAHKLGKASQGSLKAAFAHCKNIYATKYKSVKAYHMQECIDHCDRSYATQSIIKNLFWHLDRFALELDIISRCYSELVTVESTPETSKEPFTDEEIARVWESAAEPWVDSVLVFLYTGFRISELLDLQTSKIDLDAGIIIGGTKTRAGKDRQIPIHPRIEEFIRERYSSENEYLFTNNGKKITAPQYYRIWDKTMERLKMKHNPHECRHTFRSRLDSAGANKKCIDLLMGHKSKDIGERIYTHKTIEELKETIALLK